MRIINQKQIKNQLNNCYESWDQNWQYNIGNANLCKSFKYHLECEAGLKLDFEIEVRLGKMGFKINTVEVVDEEAFMLWMLKWS